MMDVTIVTKLIWDNWNLLCHVYDQEGMMAADNAFCMESEKVITEKMFVQMWSLAEKKEEPVVFTEYGSSFFFWIFPAEGYLFILGPLHSEPLSFAQRKAFLHERKMYRKDFPFKEITVAESLPIISLVYFMITGKYFNAEDISGIRQSDRQLLEELLESRSEKSREQRSHMSYQSEREWFRAISEGKILNMITADQRMPLDKVGVLAKGDTFKQIEYTVIAQLTLATRAAIEGGVPPAKAYEMSDLFFQKCAQCNETMQLLEIGTKAMDSFTKAVREMKRKGVQDPDVERCKNYIAFHLTEKIVVSEMAKELKISYSYLAAKFLKETRMNIKQFILQEKLAAAANQLKYSDIPVGEIADYFSFPSASSMCTSFRDAYGMSPTEYRRVNKVVDFISSKS